MKKDDSSLVSVPCNECGLEATITYAHYRRSKDGIFYCKKCAQKIRANAAKVKLNSEEERQKRRKRLLNNNPMHVINDEKKEGWKRKISDSNKRARVKKMTDDEKRIFGDKWNDMTSEERYRYRMPIDCKDCGSTFIISYETYCFDRNGGRPRDYHWRCKICRYKNHAVVISQLWSSRSDEEKELIISKRKLWYQNMSADEYTTYEYNRSLGYKRHMDDMNSGIYRAPSTIEFRNRLNLLVSDCSDMVYWTESSNEKVHSEFWNFFPADNPFIPGRKISPYHKWDFRVKCGTKEILIDIDGSYHSIPEGAVIRDGIDQGAYTKWLDQKRKYCTDNLDAYVIMCYDDKLTDDTMVHGFENDNIFPLHLFINIIKDQSTHTSI